MVYIRETYEASTTRIILQESLQSRRGECERRGRVMIEGRRGSEGKRDGDTVRGEECESEGHRTG